MVDADSSNRTQTAHDAEDGRRSDHDGHDAESGPRSGLGDHDAENEHRAGPGGNDTVDRELDQNHDAGPRTRTVTVPLRIYKTITVFSTLFAILGVVGGFVLLDAATNRTQAPVEEIDPLVAGLGLLLIVGGSVVYAFSTRFRAEGMGNAKERSDEGEDDG